MISTPQVNLGKDCCSMQLVNHIIKSRYWKAVLYGNFVNGSTVNAHLKPRHAKWVEFLQAFSFSIKHKAGVLNTVANALSRRYSLISTMRVQVIEFDEFKDLYGDDPDFADI
jgi:hypothetical protein